MILEGLKTELDMYPNTDKNLVEAARLAKHLDLEFSSADLMVATLEVWIIPWEWMKWIATVRIWEWGLIAMVILHWSQLFSGIERGDGGEWWITLIPIKPLSGTERFSNAELSQPFPFASIPFVQLLWATSTPPSPAPPRRLGTTPSLGLLATRELSRL